MLVFNNIYVYQVISSTSYFLHEFTTLHLFSTSPQLQPYRHSSVRELRQTLRQAADGHRGDLRLRCGMIVRRRRSQRNLSPDGTDLSVSRQTCGSHEELRRRAIAALYADRSAFFQKKRRKQRIFSAATYVLFWNFLFLFFQVHTLVFRIKTTC